MNETVTDKSDSRRPRTLGLKSEPLETTYCLGRETILPSGPSRMAAWRKKIYAYMARNAQSPTVYLGLPANRVVELGAQIEL